MTVRRAGTPGLQTTAAAAQAPAAGPPGPDASDQLVDELYRGHALRLTRMALLLLGDKPSAEDVVQEAFLGLSDSEIAADLGVSRGTVVSTASRALAALARKAGEQA